MNELKQSKRQFFSFDGTENTLGFFCEPDRFQVLQKAMRQNLIIPRGAGLSYVMGSAGSQVLSISSKKFNRILGFDNGSHCVTVESGTSIGRLLEFLIKKKRWLAPIPGHPDITIGGCMAFNIHGNSQFHTGTFSDWVDSFRLILTDGEMVQCSRTNNSELFFLTLGGLGATGFIVDVVLRTEPLPFSCIQRTTETVSSLEECIAKLLKSEKNALSIYSWNNFNALDERFGAGFVYVDEPGEEDPGSSFHWKSLFFPPRSHPVNEALVGITPVLLSKAYPLMESLRPSKQKLGLLEAQFPFVGKEIYHRLFGRKGVLEYQVLVPLDKVDTFGHSLKNLVKKHKVTTAMGSLKVFRGKGRYLSFCGDGICFTLDVVNEPKCQAFFHDLDELTVRSSALPNLSKDSRLTGAVVQKTYPELKEFLSGIQSAGRGQISSRLLSRLTGEMR